MTAIAGFFALDGAPVEAERMSRPLTAMAHRGRDRAKSWTRGPAGLARCLMITTDDDRHDQQPVWDGTRRIAFSASARLYNRDDLARQLDLGPAALAATSDSELARLAYLRWGEAALPRLIGDFALIAWHADDDTIFAAVDRFARRLLYYHVSPRRFIVASEIKGVTCHPEVPLDLDEMRIVGLSIAHWEVGATHYAAVKSLPPAHYMWVKNGRAVLERWWRPENVAPIKLASRAAYEEGFRELMLAVVPAHLRGTDTAALMFSGGMDSTSLAAIAKPALAAEGRELICYAGVAPPGKEDTRGNAREWVELGRDHLGLDVRFVHSEGRPLIADLQRDCFLSERQPWLAFGLYGWIYQAAKKDGARIVVDGIGGDYGASIKAHGAALPALKAGALGEAWQNLSGEKALSGLSWFRYLALLGAHIFAEPWLSARRRRQVRGADPWGIAPIGKAYGRAIDIEGLIKRSPFAFSFVYPVGAKRFMLTSVNHCMDGTLLTDYAIESYGLESRQPYLDPRLLEFALAAPERMHFHNGINRALMRGAMAPYLPPKLTARTGRNDHSQPDFADRMAAAKADLIALAERLEGTEPFSYLLDWEHIKTTLDAYDGSQRLGPYDAACRAQLALASAVLGAHAMGKNV